jgi:hypothetical protein
MRRPGNASYGCALLTRDQGFVKGSGLDIALGIPDESARERILRVRTSDKGSGFCQGIRVLSRHQGSVEGIRVLLAAAKR